MSSGAESLSRSVKDLNNAVSELRRVAPNFKFPEQRKPMASGPVAYKDWYGKKFIPAYRKAGLPE
jgi:hypothetical protein